MKAETCWGDTLVLCGAEPELGSWQPLKGARMQTDEHTYPVWRAKDLPLQCGSDCLEFKVVKLRAPSGDNGAPEVEWEPVSQNRQLTLLPGRRVRVSLTWGVPSTVAAVVVSTSS